MKIFAKAIALILAFYSVTAHAAIPDWSVSELSGTVTVVRAQGTSVVASRGTILRPGDAIYTAAKSRAVLVRKQEFVILAENSRIVAAPPKAGSMIQIVQTGGNAVYKIKKKTTPHFSVQTPYLAAVVKGTTFSVTVTASGASVQVMEGKVQVVADKGRAEHLLTPGKIGTVDAKSPNRLTIKGDGADIVIEGTAVSSGSQSVTPVVGAAETPAEPTQIAFDITEGTVRLEDVTDGLISGDSSLRALIRLAQLDDTNRPASGSETPGPATPAQDEGGTGAPSGNGGSSGAPAGGTGGSGGSGSGGGVGGSTGTPAEDSGSSGAPAGGTGGSDGGDDGSSKDGSKDSSKGGDDDKDDKGSKGDDDKDDKGGKSGDDDKAGKDDDDKGGKGDDDDKGGKGSKGGDDKDDKGGKGADDDDDDDD